MMHRSGRELFKVVN